MKVYMVSYFDGHDVWTPAIFATRDLAEQAVEDNPEWFDGYAGYIVREYEVVEE